MYNAYISKNGTTYVLRKHHPYCSYLDEFRSVQSKRLDTNLFNTGIRNENKKNRADKKVSQFSLISLILVMFLD